MTDTNSIEVVKAKRDATEAECNSLQQQSTRTTQFLNEVNAKGFAAQAKLEAYNELLTILEPTPPTIDAAPAASATEIPE